MEEVTPRSIAYACVQVCYLKSCNLPILILPQLHFALTDAPHWTEIHRGFNYRDLYNFIVDYFEVTDTPEAKEQARALLNWWTR